MSDTPLKYTILTPTNTSSAEEFVAFWSKVYQSSFYAENGELYSNNINKEAHDETSLKDLFKWKNGIKGNISGNKETFFTKVVANNIGTINELHSNFNLDKFIREFQPDKSAFVWKIFLLHIIQPKQFPIFDQHVYRAVCYLRNSEVVELEANKSHAKMEYYQKEYLPTFNRLKQDSNTPLKQVDEALWAFGRFLKNNHTMLQP